MAATNSCVTKKRFKINKSRKTLIFFSCLLLVAAVAHADIAKTKTANNDGSNLNKKILFNELDAKNAGKFLDWVSAPNKNSCCGYYREPKIIVNYPIPQKEAPVKITATKPALFSEYGTSIVRGNVTMTQPGRQIQADEVNIYHDAKTGKLKSSLLVGHVILREYGKMIVAERGTWDFQTNSITLYNAIYHISSPEIPGSTPGTPLDARGSARKAYRDENGVLVFTDASYSTCPPSGDAWKLKGSTVTIDKKAGRGSIVNSVLYVSNAPVFYFPYISFPTDKRRKSGFLFPALSYDPNVGIDVTLPYYFNLAPNYDLTTKLRYFGQRGFIGKALFRYLTERSHGSLDVEFLPHDSYFAKFRDNTIYPTPPVYVYQQLKNSSSTRGAISFDNHTAFDPHWSSDMEINYVTDNYFNQDLGGVSDVINNDQLFNYFDVKYAGENWNFLGRVLGFETLQTITSYPTAQLQYRRTPELDLNGFVPDREHGWDYLFSSQYVYFDYNFNRNPVADPSMPYYHQLIPFGNRVNIQPGIEKTFDWMGGQITPKLQLQSTFYGLQHNNEHDRHYDDNDHDKPLNNNIARVLPIFSLDNTWSFEKNFNPFNSKDGGYTQTLEPRLFYLYVPYQNQSDIPNFDTNLSIFDFNQLFVENRFSGLDKTSDANQASFALTTRFLDAKTAEEKLSASIGILYQFQRHRVCLYGNDCANSAANPPDPLAQNNLSPLVGKLQYNFTPHWAAIGNIAWDVKNKQANNGAISLSYTGAVNQIVSIAYNFVRDGDQIGFPPSGNLNRINFAAAWPVGDRWNLVGNWNYNISHQHPETYFYGLEYNNCCWAVRLVQGYNFIGTDIKGNNQFQHTFYLQFLLKGLSSVGTNSAGGILASQIPNYTDHFAGGFSASSAAPLMNNR